MMKGFSFIVLAFSLLNVGCGKEESPVFILQDDKCDFGLERMPEVSSTDMEILHKGIHSFLRPHSFRCLEETTTNIYDPDVKLDEGCVPFPHGNEGLDVLLDDSIFHNNYAIQNISTKNLDYFHLWFDFIPGKEYRCMKYFYELTNEEFWATIHHRHGEQYQEIVTTTVPAFNSDSSLAVFEMFRESIQGSSRALIFMRPDGAGSWEYDNLVQICTSE